MSLVKYVKLLVADCFQGQCKKQPVFNSDNAFVLLKQNAVCIISADCTDSMILSRIKAKASTRLFEVCSSRNEKIATNQENIRCLFVDATVSYKNYRKTSHTGQHHCGVFNMPRKPPNAGLAFIEPRVSLEEIINPTDFV